MKKAAVIRAWFISLVLFTTSVAFLQGGRGQNWQITVISDLGMDAPALRKLGRTESLNQFLHGMECLFLGRPMERAPHRIHGKERMRVYISGHVAGPDGKTAAFQVSFSPEEADSMACSKYLADMERLEEEVWALAKSGALDEDKIRQGLREFWDRRSKQRDAVPEGKGPAPWDLENAPYFESVYARHRDKFSKEPLKRPSFTPEEELLEKLRELVAESFKTPVDKEVFLKTICIDGVSEFPSGLVK